MSPRTATAPAVPAPRRARAPQRKVAVAPAPRRASPARPRPRLRVVDTAARSRVRRVRLLLWTFAVLVAGSLVAAAGFHVVVAQSQIEIDRLEAEAADAQQRYEQLRLEVAALAAPERIVTRARELGLGVPDGSSQVVVVPTGPGSPAPGPPESTGTTLAESWPEVKRHLDATP